MNTERSDQLYTKALDLMPGGVNSPVRAFRQVGRAPVFMESGYGSHVYDADGNAYIDYVCSWGPNILGHAHPAVVEAVQRACEKGLSFGAPTENEVLLAELIRRHYPVMESLRMVNSGTEAVMSAVRAARGFTGRDKIVKFQGCYHGHSDGLLVKAGSGVLDDSREAGGQPLGVPDSLGVPAAWTADTLVAAYNHADSVRELFARFPGQIAAVLVEPAAANMGVVPPRKGFLEELRSLCSRNGALLIFDEVITGFRIGLGGACAYYGVEPDLATLGKIVGGGLPVGVYGGRREIMQLISPCGGVYQAGTLSGNPVAAAAGIATLRALEEQPSLYGELEEKGAFLQKVMEEAFGAEAVCVNRVGSLMSLFFTGEDVEDYDAVMRADAVRYRAYFNYLLEHGVYLAPSPYEAMFLSCAHTAEDLARTAEVIRAFASALRK